MTRHRCTLLILVTYAIALAPKPNSAFPSSSLFEGNDDKGNSSSKVSFSDQATSTPHEPNATLRQPLLDPEEWFLTEQEITDSRGGNAVTAYAASNEFFNAIYDDISTTKEGDRIMLAAWLVALIPLKPDVDPAGSGFKEVFAIVVTKEQTNAFTNAGYIKYLYESVNPIRSKYPDKFQIYTIKADRKLLIHSKIVIIDDVYLSIGSANWNRRSMTADSELNAEVVDTEIVKSPEGLTVGKSPRDFHIRKFAEMTSLSYSELDAMTIVEAADQFVAASRNKSTILAKLEIEYHPYYIAITDLMRKVSDPQFTCTTNDN